MSMRPGETNKVSINYAPWVLPLGNGANLMCSTDIDVQLDEAGCPQATGSNPPPSNTSYKVWTSGAAVVADLAANAAPTSGTFEYERTPLSGPYNGTVVIDPATGQATYTPNGGFKGVDRFYYTMTDASKRSIIKEVVVEVSDVENSVPAPFTPAVSVDMGKLIVNDRTQTVSFPVSVSPAARSCEIYKINVKQFARDCSGACFSHISCYDLSIGKC